MKYAKRTLCLLLACALLFPLIPPLRGALFGADVPPEGKAPDYERGIVNSS